MRSIKILSALVVFTIAALSLTAFKTTHSARLTTENKGFAVVELFTSEGCSSCPPADELVARIEKESAGKPVYILAFHVDYWNRLGWKDPFSSSEFSKRQSSYANYLNLTSVYTPQIVVNGKTEFVGSQEGTLRNAIKAGLQKPANGTVDIQISAINKKDAMIKYNIAGDYKNSALLVAILQKNAQTKVERGENGGRTLSHVQIVRKLQQLALNSNNGTTNITLPAGFDDKAWEIIGFVQNTSTGIITAANKAVFTDSTGMAAVKDAE